MVAMRIAVGWFATAQDVMSCGAAVTDSASMATMNTYEYLVKAIKLPRCETQRNGYMS